MDPRVIPKFIYVFADRPSGAITKPDASSSLNGTAEKEVSEEK